MRRLGLLIPLLALLLALPARAEAAKPKPDPNVGKAKAGLAAALAAGRISPAEAAQYRGILARTARALPRLGGSRHANLAGVLSTVAAQHARYTERRALVLFSMLDVNVRWFGAQGPPKPQADETGPDGAVYRYFPGRGLQFHPLANAAALNSQLAAGRLDRARALVEALQARAIQSGGTLLWEYEFPFGGGRPPWTSGMAQAVLAQAFARAAGKLDDPSLLDVAGRAYASIPGKLEQRLSVGRWVRLYSFSRLAVFNAQLQAAVSLQDYAALSGSEEAASLATAMRDAAQKALPRVDTGYWTRYTIDGAEESRGYHDFVISILGRLKAQTKDTAWSDLAARFERYEREPPVFLLGAPAAPAVPGTGKAKLKVTFWLSKRSSTSVKVGSSSRSVWLAHGWHTFTWTLPRAKPAVYPVGLQAWPIAGPRGSTGALPLVVLGRGGPEPKARHTSASAAQGLVVGAAENGVLSADPGTADGRLALATAAGMTAIRVAVPWAPGQTAPAADALAAYQTTAQQAQLRGIRLFFEVYPSSPDAAPRDDAARGQFAEYLRSLATALPQVRDFVVGSQVNSPSFWPQGGAAATEYAALLAASYDALKAVDPAIRVIGGSLSAQDAPGTYVLALGKAYRKLGRATPFMDAFAIQPNGLGSAEPPATVHAKGPIGIGDYARLVANLKRAFDGTPQPGSTVPIVYDGYGVQSLIPPEKAPLYSQTESDAVDEAVQATSYAAALKLASCQPTVTTLLLGHVLDEADLTGSQAGLYYADGTPKSSLGPFVDALAGLAGASCPQQQQQPEGPGTPPTVSLDPAGGSAAVDCPSDCWYVAVLTRGEDKVPVRAAQGAVDAGGQTTVSPSTLGLRPGSYTLSVWAAPKRAAGPAVETDGSPFAVG